MAADMAMTVGHEIERDADDGQPVSVLLLESDQLRRFADAGGTPSRPEVDQHNFATQLRESDLPAAEVRKRKICRRHRLASAGCFGRDFKPDWREISLMCGPPRLSVGCPSL